MHFYVAFLVSKEEYDRYTHTDKILFRVPVEGILAGHLTDLMDHYIDYYDEESVITYTLTNDRNKDMNDIHTLLDAYPIHLFVDGHDYSFEFDIYEDDTTMLFKRIKERKAGDMLFIVDCHS
jgi:hypothetical protein